VSPPWRDEGERQNKRGKKGEKITLHGDRGKDQREGKKRVARAHLLFPFLARGGKGLKKERIKDVP